MKEYLEKFRLMAKEIAYHPKLILLDYKEFKPITDADFNNLENDIGFIIPRDIKLFYQLTNGIKLSWIHLEDHYFSPEKHVAFNLPNDFSEFQSRQAPEYDCSSHKYGGSIDIKGIIEVFQHEFPWNPYAQQKGYYIFDSFSNAYGAAISFPNSQDQASVTVSSDYEYFGDYDNSMPFLKYLDFIIETKGIKNVRTYISKNTNRALAYNLFKSQGIDKWPEEFCWYEN